MKKLLNMIILVLFFAHPVVAATTYYIDYSAADNSENGTDKATPWKVAPGMTNCDSVCGSYSHSAGDIFIFKGGETWPNTELPLVIANSGSEGNVDEYTTDQTWYTGGAWSQPIFDQSTTQDNIIESNGQDYLKINDIKLTGNSAAFTYNGAIYIDKNSNNIELNSLFITTYGSCGIYVDGKANAEDGIPSNITIDSCEITLIRHEGILLRGGIGTTMIKNSSIHDGPYKGVDGIQATQKAFGDGTYYINGLTIQDNNIYNFPQKGNIIVSGDNIIIERNRIWNDGNYSSVDDANNTMAWGLVMYSGIPSVALTDTPIIIRNNLIYGESHFGGALRIRHDATSAQVDGVNIYNNTIYGGGNAEPTSIFIDENNGTNFTNVRIKNNIIHTNSNSRQAIVFETSNVTSGADVSNNLYYYGTESTPLDWEGDEKNYADWVTASGDINSIDNSDPSFENPGYAIDSNFQIASGDPGVDAGADLSGSFTDDIQGQTRPQPIGGDWDIGAYEYDPLSQPISGTLCNGCYPGQ
jgi:hypothetical protein